MLKLSGYSVAMGNANQEAMQTATYQTDDNKHGGVAKSDSKMFRSTKLTNYLLYGGNFFA